MWVILQKQALLYNYRWQETQIVFSSWYIRSSSGTMWCTYLIMYKCHVLRIIVVSCSSRHQFVVTVLSPPKTKLPFFSLNSSSIDNRNDVTNAKDEPNKEERNECNNCGFLASKMLPGNPPISENPDGNLPNGWLSTDESALPHCACSISLIKSWHLFLGTVLPSEIGQHLPGFLLSAQPPCWFHESWFHSRHASALTLHQFAWLP